MAPWDAGGIAGIITAVGLFGWIPVMVWWKHRIRLEEIRSQRGAGVSEETIFALREMQRELRELRETTTKFDLSFDAGLDRLESRVGQLEEHTVTTDTTATTRYRNGAATESEAQTLTVGNRAGR